MEDHYWVTTAYEEEEEPEGEKERKLEVEVATLKKELAEVRKDLAAKTVLLSKRDTGDKAAQERWAEQRAAELAAAALAPKDQLISSLQQSITQLEVTLAQRTEELEDSKRLFASQKRALKDALSAAAEREAAEAEATAAGRSAATAAAEEELERLLQELEQAKTRSALEVQGRETEIQQLKQQLAIHQEEKQCAVEAAEAAAMQAHQNALAAAAAAHTAQMAELQAELNRAQSSVPVHLKEEQEELSSDLASIRKANMQLQREFDAFKDLTAQTHRQHREEQARLLEENAALKARIAADAARAAMGGAGGAPGVVISKSKTFTAASEGVWGALDQLISNLERHRRGLVPVLVIGSLVMLVLVIAVVRAAASTRGEHKGTLCFLSKLGVQIGQGCGSSAGLSTPSKQVVAALNDLVEATPRVRDVGGAAGTAEYGGKVTAGGQTAAVRKAGEGGDVSKGFRRLLQTPVLCPGSVVAAIGR